MKHINRFNEKSSDELTISELIKKLEEIKNTEGDLKVCLSESHEYWGSVQTYLTDYNMNVMDAQPEGPKSGKSERCLVLYCNN